MLRCPVEKCENKKNPRHCTCRSCWYKLPFTTRRELRKRDGKAMGRLKRLAQGIAREWPMQHILIQDNEAGDPELIFGG